MILCEFTPTGYSLQRIALRDIALEYQWYSYIISFSSFRLSLPYDYGGYVEPEFTDLELSPEMFDGISPIPETSTVKLIEIDETDPDATASNGTVIFEGAGALSYYDRYSVKYTITKDTYEAEVASGTTFSGTLNSVMATLCGGSYLNVTLDTTKARETSPDVSFTVSSDITAIDLASEMCAWFSHGFYITDGTLYLVDLLLDTSVDYALDEFDVLPCSYSMNSPISLITCDTGSVTGSNSSGDTKSISTPYHTTTANIEAALTDILSILESPRAEIPIMMQPGGPGIMDIVTLTDESTVNTITSKIRVTSVIYNFDDERYQIEGFGVIT